MATTNPQEIASVFVNGREYTEWESVWVQERWTEPFAYARFTANEGRLNVNNWRTLQFKPGDPAVVSLGGQPIINGFITVRQTSANATAHMVQHTIKSYSFWPYKSSVFTTDGNFDGKTFLQIADIVLARWGGYEKLGEPLDPSPFKTAQSKPGDNIWEWLEEKARSKGAILGTAPVSGRPLIIGAHDGTIIGHVTDGDNILQIQCTISIEAFMTDYYVNTSQPGDDQTNGPDAAQPPPGYAPGYAPVPSILYIPMEDPGGKPQADMRASFEARWTHASEITCNVTVPGWFAQNGGLWHAGMDVMVYSPMAMVVGEVLKINTATFQQDNNTGTTTTLELVAPWGRLDQINANTGPTSGSVAPGPPTATQPPAQPTATGSPASPPPSLANQAGLGDIQATLGEKLGLGDIGKQ